MPGKNTVIPFSAPTVSTDTVYKGHHEPQSELKLPPSTQPTIRVGLVLPEDSVPEVTVASQSPLSLVPEGASEKRDPQSTATFCVKLDSSGNNLQLNAGSQTAASFLANSDDPISLSPIPVGRGFHWQTTETFRYPGSIQLDATQTGVEAINQVSFEEYVACVVTSEMGANCPLEFAKAQMIAARSWAYVFMGSKHPGSAYDVCNDDDCQRYQGVTFLSDISRAAAKETHGVYLVDDNGFVVPAYYAKTCGGMSESANAMLHVSANGVEAAADSSLGKAFDLSNEADFERYLDSPHEEIFCSGMKRAESSLLEYLGAVDKGGIFFRWKKEISSADLCANLIRLGLLEFPAELLSLVVLSRSVSGRIQSLSISFSSGVTVSLQTQYSIRQALSPDFLYSSAFIHSFDRNEIGSIYQIRFDGLGWGHGVGFCQVGALVQALEGRSAEQILKTYFPHTRLEKKY